MRAVCYARVSSATQRERDTIASQIRDLPAFVERQGWTLVRPIMAYVDDGRTAKSGHLEARTGLAALLRDAGAGVFDVVVVTNVDRLTRAEDLAERGLILGALQAAGVRVASTSGELLDLNTDHGDLLASIAAYGAAAENRKRRDRIVAGKLTAIQRGRKPSGPTPYGLAYDRATGNWSVHPVTGPLVVEMYERIVAGESTEAIARDFDARGIPRPRGIWCREKVYQILRSRHPMGEWHVDKRRGLTIAVPPIVTESLWQRAQDTLIAHGKRGLRRTKHVYLLEGLAVCGACGAPMHIRSMTTGRFGPRPPAYVCSRRKLKRRGVDRCAAAIAKIAEVDARVWDSICRELEDDELLAHIAAERGRRVADHTAWERDVADYGRRLTRLAKHEAAVLSRARSGAISEEAMDVELAAMRKERDALRSQLATAERGLAAAENGNERLGDVVAVWKRLRLRLSNAAPADRLEIVRALVDRGGAVFAGDRVKLTLLVPTAEVAASRVELASVSLADTAGYSSIRESHVRIRVVA